MFSYAIERFNLEINDLRSYAVTNRSVRALLKNAESLLEPSILEDTVSNLKILAPSDTRWRVLEHSLIVSRLYAIYESFCEALLGDWITFLSNTRTYSKLPKKITENYPYGLANILGMLPSPRYPALNVKELISGYHAALEGNNDYSISPQCLIHHKNNLRWGDLLEILGKCAIEDFSGWVVGSQDLLGYLSSGTERVIDRLSAKLEVFIQYRNDSSHGIIEVDEILGHDEQLELIEFVSALCRTLDNCVRWKMIQSQVDLGNAHFLGRISEVFPKANAAILVGNKAKLKVGQKIHVRKESNLYEDTFYSLQIDGFGTHEILTTNGTEVGIRLEKLPAKGSFLYSL